MTPATGDPGLLPLDPPWTFPGAGGLRQRRRALPTYQTEVVLNVEEVSSGGDAVSPGGAGRHDDTASRRGIRAGHVDHGGIPPAGQAFAEHGCGAR
jgi:hypothetical protein